MRLCDYNQYSDYNCHISVKSGLLIVHVFHNNTNKHKVGTDTTENSPNRMQGF